MNNFTLKTIAILSMLIDHIGAVFYPQYGWMRIVGRLAFPIFCFLLVEGMFHTRDIKNYAVRLGLFAFLSEIPFDLAFYGTLVFLEHQNVFFTLFIGLIVIVQLEKSKKEGRKGIIGGIIAILGMLLAHFLKTDYGFFGILLILCFYIFRISKVKKTLAAVLLNISAFGVQVFAALGLIPIWFYNGKKGPSMKYVFYGFYPVHLLIIYIIKQTV